MKWYLKCLNQYADFSGRARRTEYWMFILFNGIFTILASIMDTLIFGIGLDGMGLFWVLYSLGIFIPSLAVTVRRLHDVGMSGWLILLIFIPIIGWIWLFVLFVTDSQNGVNRYGQNPKEYNLMFNDGGQTGRNSHDSTSYNGGYSGGHNKQDRYDSAIDKPSNIGGYRDGDLYK